MVDLNMLLQAVLNAEASLKTAETDVAEAEERRGMASAALQREQAAFDAAVKEARALARPSATACVDHTTQILQEMVPAAASKPEAVMQCPECGQPMEPNHTCRRMEGEPGPLPRNSPALSWAARSGAELPGFGPEPDDDREDNLGAD